MSKENSTRNGCKDGFRTFLVKNVQFDTELEIPCIKPESNIPQIKGQKKQRKSRAFRFDMLPLK